MNKTGIAAVVGVFVLGAGYLGACWLTGNIYDQQLQQRMQLWNQQPGTQVEWQPGDAGLWHRDGVLHVTLSAERVQHYAPFLADLQSEPQPLELFIQVQQGVGALTIQGQAQVDSSRGSLASWLKQAKLQSLPHQVNWQFNAINQHLQGDVRLDPWKVVTDEGRVEFALLKLQASGTLDQQADIQLEWDGMSAGNEATQLVHLAPVRSEIRFENNAGIWLSPAYHVQLAGVRYVSPEQNFTLQQLDGQGAIEEQGSEADRRLNIQFNSKVELVEMKGQQQNFTIDKMALGLDLQNIDKQGYLALLQSQQASTLGQMQTLAAMQQIASKGLAVTLDTLTLDYNKANFHAQGNVALSADQRPVLGLPQLLARLQAQLDLVAMPELVAQLPNGEAMLKPMLSQGYVKQGNDGKLSSQLKLTGGKATANGVALPL